MQDAIDMTTNPFFNKILLFLILLGIGGIIGGMKFLYKYFKTRFEELYREIKYSQDYQAAMDSALEHSLKNGYATERDRKLDILNVKDSRIHK